MISLEIYLAGDFRTAVWGLSPTTHRGTLNPQWIGRAPLNTVSTSVVVGRVGCLATVAVRESHKRSVCCTKRIDNTLQSSDRTEPIIRRHTRAAGGSGKNKTTSKCWLTDFSFLFTCDHIKQSLLVTRASMIIFIIHETAKFLINRFVYKMSQNHKPVVKPTVKYLKTLHLPVADSGCFRGRLKRAPAHRKT